MFAALPATTLAQEPDGAPVPDEVKALAGCWSGSGSVMGKPVAIGLDARSITGDALFVVDVDSHALADPEDRYAAHLIFGGKTVRPEDGDAKNISAFFADSFGGDFTGVGTGSVRPDGFEVAYAYPDASFVNRWRVAGDAVSWTITARTGAGHEEPFATYDLVRAACAGA
ncbi:hypothetical protein [Brevundimonas sp.]|uniref:hypothetical protein n=1 Tax=Brevundimonas sp. TaxID=1871086 RepID=UPI002FCAE6B5